MTADLHDPGGRVRTALPDGMIGWAEFSDCGRYRHVLGRYWGDQPDSFDFTSDPYVLWIGMNPSTATGKVNDPTITREVGFTAAWGFTCYVKVNVMDYRATDPKDLRRGVEVCSPGNLQNIVGLAQCSHRIVAAWGALPRGLRWAARNVVWALREKRCEMHCLGRTKSGAPRHPLYLPKTTDLVRFVG